MSRWLEPWRGLVPPPPSYCSLYQARRFDEYVDVAVHEVSDSLVGVGISGVRGIYYNISLLEVLYKTFRK